jgi:hypothetical protein
MILASSEFIKEIISHGPKSGNVAKKFKSKINTIEEQFTNNKDLEIYETPELEEKKLELAKVRDLEKKYATTASSNNKNNSN